MAAVAPVGVKKTNRAEFVSGLGGGAKIGQRIVMPAQQRLPRRGAGADVKWNFRPGKLCSFFFKRVAGLVTPVQRDDLLRKFANEAGIFQNDVAPEHHLPVARPDLVMDFFEKVRSEEHT